MAAEPLLRVRDLTLSLATPREPVLLVDGVSFEIAPGETLGLLGESGCGKTLTALALLRLLPPGIQVAGGCLFFDGTDLLQLPRKKMRGFRGGQIAMVFQEPMTALNPVLTAGSQVAEVLALHRGLGRGRRREEVVRLFTEVGLPDPEGVLRRYPHQLSGGMCQRVMIAMALAGEPRLLVADEPTTALDVTVQAQILELLARIQRERGLALLLVTHDLGVAAETCDRITVLYGGRVAESAPTKTLFTSARHPYTQGLLAALPRLGATGLPRPLPGRVPPPEDFLPGCRFRDRCPEAGEDCGEVPLLETLDTRHAVACWRALVPGREGSS
ncbi:MAG: ABC transporter ATP-binding protein [Planctomycetota bacterium]